MSKGLLFQFYLSIHAHSGADLCARETSMGQKSRLPMLVCRKGRPHRAKFFLARPFGAAGPVAE